MAANQTSFVTTTDLINALGDRIYEILNVADDADISTNDQVLSAIATANAMVTNYLRGRYKLPLKNTTPDVCDAARAIAVYKLRQSFARETFSGDLDRQPYEDALDFLKLVANGTVKLLDPPADTDSGRIEASLVTVGGGVTHEDQQTASSPDWFAEF